MKKLVVIEAVSVLSDEIKEKGDNFDDDIIESNHIIESHVSV